jgi:putative iron-regulated protein
MAKLLKTWTSLGLIAVTSATIGHAASLTPASPPNVPKNFILVEDTNGEGGGESGGGLTTTYALGSTDTNAFKYDAAPQINAYADLVATSYADNTTSTQALVAAVSDLLKAPTDQTLAAARSAWIAARPAYLKTEAFRFYDGPIEKVEGEMNAWPMNEAHIDYVEGKPDTGLINDQSVVLDIASITGKNQADDEADVTTGWHAVEFLLWGQDFSATGPGNRPVTDFISGQNNNDRRRTYLELVTAKLLTDSQMLEKAWAQGDKNNYRTAFLALPQREAIGRMINGMAILAGYEFMSQRLAVALDSGDQEDEHSCFSDNTKNDFVYDLEGVLQVWTGDTGSTARAGLDELVRAQNPELATEIDAMFAEATRKVAKLGSPWDQVLAAPTGSPERLAAEDVVTALQALATGLTKAGNLLGVIVLVPAA